MTRSFVLVVSLAALPSAGLALCFEPSAPSCVSGYGPFDSEWEFDDCRREVLSFQDETEEYLVCLQRELEDEADRIQTVAASEIEEATRRAERLAATAIDEAEQAVDDFNDRASD